jgi:hypothetical protein
MIGDEPKWLDGRCKELIQWPRLDGSDILLWIWIRILLFTSLTFKTTRKNLFFIGFSAYYF